MTKAIIVSVAVVPEENAGDIYDPAKHRYDCFSYLYQVETSPLRSHTQARYSREMLSFEVSEAFDNLKRQALLQIKELPDELP